MANKTVISGVGKVSTVNDPSLDAEIAQKEADWAIQKTKTQKPLLEDIVEALLLSDNVKVAALKSQYQAWKAGN